MEEIFLVILEQLKNLGYIVDKNTIKKHSTQGFMSSVYTASSNNGSVVIHVVNPIKEHVRNESWNKLVGLGKLLTKHEEIPSAEVVLGGTIEEKYFIVQKMLSGEPAGKRALEGLEVVDTWFGQGSDLYKKRIQEILSDIHRIPVSGCGWPILRNNLLVGRYKNWKDFLETESFMWFESILAADKVANLDLPIKISLDEIKKFVSSVIEQIKEVQPILIHGDAINPSNLLVKNNEITGLLDWEWSIFGDPAWEFGDPGWDKVIEENGIDTYLERSKLTGSKEKDFFLHKVKMYRPLWCLWGAHMHSGKPQGELYKVLRHLLNKSIKNAN